MFKKQPKSAEIARDRLTLVLSHERVNGNVPLIPFLEDMKKDIINVIQKYIDIDANKINIKSENIDNLSMLEVEILLDK